jgi:hypothetical protein
MNWGTIRPGLKALITSLSGGLEAFWVDEPRGFTDPSTQAILTLTIKSVTTIGWDEMSQLQDLTKPTGHELQDEWRGNRRFTLSIKAESEIQTDTGSAYQYLENVRDRLNFRGSCETLRGLDCVVVNLIPTEDLTAALDDRNRSIAVLDVIMNARVLFLDPAEYGYIETAPVTGTLTS